MAHGATPPEIDQGRLGGADALMDRLVGEGLVAGAAVQVAQHGRSIYERTVGWADLSERRPIAKDTIYRIYSMTKPVVATAAMILVEAGKLRLDDSVEKYVPEFAHLRVYAGGEGHHMETVPARRMTVEHLLTHTSGLSNSWNPGHVSKLYKGVGLSAGSWLHDPEIKGLPDFAARLARVPLEFQPGTAWLYSYSPDVAGLVIERASGMPFGEFLKDRIFRPLGMADTGFSTGEGNADRLAASYARAFGRLIRIEDAARSPFRIPPAAESGAAGLVSTLSDYGRFAQMLACGGALGRTRILSAASAKSIMSSHVDPQVLGPRLQKFAPFGLGGKGEGMGFGLCGAILSGVKAGSARAPVSEYTWGGAASTTFWVSPEIELSVVFMTQLTPSGALPLRDWLREAIYGALV